MGIIRHDCVRIPVQHTQQSTARVRELGTHALGQNVGARESSQINYGHMPSTTAPDGGYRYKVRGNWYSPLPYCSSFLLLKIGQRICCLCLTRVPYVV